MATYNGADYVAEQVRSIQEQTYTNWRLLVSDDMSTDATPSILSDLAAKDPRIVVLPRSRRWGSAKANFQHLLQNADASYVMLCDQDDYWLPSKIDRSISAIQELEKNCDSNIPLLAFCDMKVVDGNLNVLHDSFEKSSNFNPSKLSFRYLLAQNCAAGCCMVFNRETVEKFLLIDNPEPVDMHDWWLMLVASAFGRIGYIDESLSLYRQHGSNEVGANDYSPLHRFMDQDFMCVEFLKTTKQAEAFRSVYAESLCESNLKTLKNYSAIERDSSFVIALMHLAMSGCWKKGIRKFGQIAMLFKISRINRRKGL